MQDFKTTALMCTPSHALSIADSIIEMGINVNSMSLKYGLFGAEPWSEAMRHELQEKLKIIATDSYGLSEVMSPTARAGGETWRTGTTPFTIASAAT